MKKTTELLPLLVNKGGAVLHCGLWKRAGRAVSLSTRSVHTPWLVPTGPTHRPVIMWLSAASGPGPSRLDWRDRAFCSSRTTKSRSATGYMLSILVCKWDAAWCGRKGTGLDVTDGTLTGHTSMKKGLHFVEPQFPCLIRETASALLPQGLLERSNGLKHFVYPSYLNVKYTIGWPLTKLSCRAKTRLKNSTWQEKVPTICLWFFFLLLRWPPCIIKSDSFLEWVLSSS